MNEVKVIDRTMDPALKRLLDELPEGDPDLALVWTEHTPEKRLVPVNQEVYVRFGVWSGPPTGPGDVIVLGEYCGVGGHGYVMCDKTIYPGDSLEATIVVRL